MEAPIDMEKTKDTLFFPGTGAADWTQPEKDGAFRRNACALLNDTLDPFDAPIGEENLDLVYIDGGLFRSTSGTIRGENYLYRK